MAEREVSVVMGTYNGAAFIREQLQSILDQQELPREIIVSDDGSSDDTLTVVEEVAAGSATVPIHIHRNPERLGFADNFLSACRHASGRYVAFSDQDDRWYPQKLRVSRESLVAHDAVLCVHAVDDIDSEGAFLRKNTQRISELRVLERLQGNPWDVYYGFTMLFERSLLDRVDSSERGKDIFTPGKPLSHDRWVYFLASCFGRVVTLADSLAGYRQHASQLYGGPAGRSLMQRVSEKFAEGGSRLGYLAEVADERVGLLHTMAETGDRSAAEAETRWQRYAQALHTSSRIRSDRGFGRRLLLWSNNLRTGGYRSLDRGGLGVQYLLEDAAVLSLLPVAARAQRRDHAVSSSRTEVR